jgi:hypothetical protein
MILKTISTTYGRKLNLGDYNSVHIEMSLWAELEDGDDEALAADALRQMARHQVMAEMARVKPELAAKITDIFMGLPTAVREQIEYDGSAEIMEAWELD